MDNVNWDDVKDEVVDYLRDLIKINTTNPPGNEIEAARYLSDVLKKEGIDARILEPSPGRGNLISRLNGSDEGDPLMLFSHLDVVEAKEEEWERPPFSGDLSDGCVWGRGALDMKGMVAMELMTFILLKRTGIKLQRDVILAAVADEEAGGAMGASWLVDNHPDLIRSEYAINEFGGFTLYIKGKPFYPIQIAEKGYCWLELKAKGQPGHGSMPHSDNAVVKLSRAIEKIDRKGLPQHNTEVMETFIRTVAKKLPAPTSTLMPLLLNPILGPILLKFAISPDQAKSFRALLHNTATPTVLQAGGKINVIPTDAEAKLDGRILPGQNEDDLIRELKDIIGDECELKIISSSQGYQAEKNTPLYHTMEEVIKVHHPEGIPVPYMVPGMTDARHLGRLKIKCYGFSPLRLPESLLFNNLIHGHNERVPVDALIFGVKVLFNLLKNFCA